MHRLPACMVRRHISRPEGQVCRRNTASLALSHLLPVNELDVSATQEVDSTQAAIPSARHTFNPNYFDTKQKELAKLRGGDPQDVVSRLRKVLDQRDVNTLHLVYDELRTMAIQLKDPSHASSHREAQMLGNLQVEDIRAAMRIALGPAQHYLSQSWTHTSGKEKVYNRPLRNTAEKISDGQLTQQMFDDMSEIFGFAQERIDCEKSVLACALQTNSSQEVFDRFRKLQSSFDTYQQSYYIHESAAILLLCNNEAEGTQIAQQLWTFLEEIGVRIRRSTRDLYFHLLFKAGKVTQAQEIAQDGSKSTQMLSLSQEKTSSLSRFFDGIARAGEGQWWLAEKMADEVLQRAQNDKTLVSRSSWHNLLTYTGIVKGTEAALILAKDAQNRDLFEADRETFMILLLTQESHLNRIAQSGTEEDVMRLFGQIQDSCNVQPPNAAFTIAVCAVLGLGVPSLRYRVNRQDELIDHRKGAADDQEKDNLPNEMPRKSVPKHTPGQIHEANLLYNCLKSRGLQPTAALVSPLIVAYTSSYIPQVDKALHLYKDWRALGKRLQINTYNALLFACAKAKDLKAGQQIIQDMINLGISLSHRILADLVVMLMEVSQSYQSAHEIYTRVRDSAEKLNKSTSSSISIFDESGWLKIIDRYSRLHFAQESLPPIDHILQMLVDMRASGFAPEAKHYSILISLYGRKATVFLEGIHSLDPKDTQRRARMFANMEEIRAAISRIHHFLQAEESIEPDLHLITCLMDAYNRVSRSQYALEIWHRLVLNKTLVDSACIAVVLDTCGHARLIHEARNAWKWVQRNQLQRGQCNKNVWDAWVECLARCGHLSEAIDIAFKEMSQGLSETKEGPDAKTMEMLLRFSSSEQYRWSKKTKEEYWLLGQLKSRLQTEMPTVWEQVKDIQIPLEK